jgi:hypothetical protein
VPSLWFRTILLHDDAGAPNDLARVALTVNLTEASPGTENFGITDTNKWNAVRAAKCLDEFYVLRLSASLDKNAEMGFALVESFGAFTEAASKTVMNERRLQNLL